jgi:hypothetical protein
VPRADPPPGPFPISALIDACVLVHTNRWVIPLLDVAHKGLVRPLWSPLIISEVNRVLTWRWIKRHRGDLTDSEWRQCSTASKRWFAELTTVFRVVEDCPPQVPLWAEVVPDEWDAPLWTAAKRGEASFIVTENLEDGPPLGPDGIREHDGVYVVHPDTFLALIDELADGAFLQAEREGSPYETRDSSPGYREMLQAVTQRQSS